MTDERRTREDLLAEIEELRALVTELRHRDEARMHTEQALVDSRNTLQLVMDTIPQRVFWKDRELKYLGCNAVFARDAGLSAPDEIVGKHDYELPWKETAALYRSDDELVMQGREAKVNYVEPMNRPDGSVRWLRTTKVPLLDHRGEVIGVFGCYEDITERKHAEDAERRLEEQLRHVQRLESLGRLAGGVAHDFNNLLTAILTNCDILHMKLERAGIESHELEQVQRAGRRAAALTSQLLSFSRKQVIQPRVVDLNAVVTDTQTMLARLIGEDIDLEVRLEPGPCLVLADPGQLGQILVNLAVNARDAMVDGGELVIETRRVRVGEPEARRHPGMAPGAFVTLRVSDTGVGMDDATMEHLFEPFFTTKDKGKGTGLGLATVYGIVRRASGGIDVESESGRGTTITVYLPESAGPVETAVAAGAEDGATSNGGTILLVEDEDSVRASASEILRAGGYRVIAATDGEDALRLYEEHAGHVDLLVTDVVMPKMGGPELAEALRRRAPHMKMLFVSGYTDDLLGERGVLSPDVELLHKPFSRRPLLDKVREVLSTK